MVGSIENYYALGMLIGATIGIILVIWFAWDFLSDLLRTCRENIPEDEDE